MGHNPSSARGNLQRTASKCCLNNAIRPRQAPGNLGPQLQKLHRQQGDECCSTLRLQPVGGRAREGLDRGDSAWGLEQQFNRLALLVDGLMGPVARSRPQTGPRRSSPQVRYPQQR